MRSCVRRHPSSDRRSQTARWLTQRARTSLGLAAQGKRPAAGVRAADELHRGARQRGLQAERLAGDIDWEGRKAWLRKTKNGAPRVVPLPGLVFEALWNLKGAKGTIFGFKTRHTLNQALERACKRAGVRVMTSHEVGRHAFAARLLAQGFTLKQVQEAGGWKSYRMVAEVYGHLEKSSVHDAMRQSDTKLAQLMVSGANVVRI